MAAGAQMRTKLTVIEAKEPQSVGTKGAQKLSFWAKQDGDSRQYVFFTFRRSLFPHIKPGELDAEVEVKENTYQGETYIDRKVTELYIDGQPISNKQFFAGRFGSSDAQVAARIAADLLIQKIISHDHELSKALLSWCESKLKG
jgi:hypothetical protein